MAKKTTTDKKEEAVIAAAPEKTEKKAAPKKTAAPAEKKAAAPKKAAEERKVVIQANGGEVTGTELIDKAKAAANISTAKKVVVYVRPEINKVFYVIDDEIFGDFDLV